MVNGWKITAIIFIIIFLIETLGIIYVFDVGYNSVRNKTKCSQDVCWDADSFSYDSTTGVCLCYRNNIVVTHQLIE